MTTEFDANKDTSPVTVEIQRSSFDKFNTSVQETAMPTLPPVREIPIYACGGAGINNGANLLNDFYGDVPKEDRGFYAKPKVVFIDGSRQNQGNIPAGNENNTYFLRRIDNTVDPVKYPDGIELSGGGGDRSFINDVAIYNAPLILQRHQPSKVMNILIFSLAGASGSTVGQHLFKELVRQGYPVIAIIIEVNASASRQSNTNKTLINLINYQQKSEVSAGIYRVTNKGLTINAEKEADENISSFMFSFLSVMSGIASRLDEKDIQNWLDYFKVTRGGNPELLEVDFATANNLGTKNAKSIIGIVKPDVDPLPDVENALSKAFYVKMGVIDYASHPMDEVYLTATPIDMRLLQFVDSKLSESTEQIRQHEESQRALQSSISRWSKNMDDESGLV